MKNISLFSLLLLIAPFSFSQISITNADVSNLYTIGNSVTMNFDTSITIMHIGNTVAPNTWTFSHMTPEIPRTYSIINVAGTPSAANFPNATFVQHYSGNMMGINTDEYVYWDLASDLAYHGNYSVFSGGMTITSTRIENPKEVTLKLPLSLGATWTHSGTATTTSSSAGLITDTYTSTYTVDAYGTMTLPGTSPMNALRLKRDLRTYTNSNGTITYDRVINYTFIAKNGSAVQITASDTNAASTGAIGIIPFSSYMIHSNSGINDNDAVCQSGTPYPNPAIDHFYLPFDLRSPANVILSITNISGQVIYKSEARNYSQGNHKLKIDCPDLSPGLYTICLIAGNTIFDHRLIIQ